MDSKLSRGLGDVVPKCKHEESQEVNSYWKIMEYSFISHLKWKDFQTIENSGVEKPARWLLQWKHL